MRAATSFLFFIFLSTTVTPQDSPPPLNQWKGLILGESSLADAVKFLGDPAKKTTSQKLEVMTIEKWISDVRKEKIFDKYEWKNVELDGRKYKNVQLFIKNGILMALILDLEGKDRPEAHSFPMTYSNVEFSPVFNWTAGSDHGLKRREDGNLYAEKYPQKYWLKATTKEAFISIEVNRGFWGEIGSQLGSPDQVGYPGHAEKIQIITSQLANTEAKAIF